MHRTSDGSQNSRTPIRNPKHKLEEEDCEKGRTGAEARRDKARSRHFEMQVSNISIISDKISGLLSLIKRDRFDETAPAIEKPLPLPLPKHTTSINQNIRQQIQRRDKSETLSPLMRAQRTPVHYKASQQVRSDAKYEYIRKEQPIQEKKLSDISNQLQAKYQQQQQQAKPEKQPKRTYLPPEDHPPPPQKQKPIKEENFEQTMRKYEIKIERRNQYTPPPPTTLPPQPPQHNLNKKKIQNMEKEPTREPLQNKFEKITIQAQPRPEPKPSLKQAASAKQLPKQPLFILQSAIPKPQASNFLPMVLPEQSNRNQKLNTTTKLIDEQIKRIKCKIEESEGHSQRIQAKLERSDPLVAHDEY